MKKQIVNLFTTLNKVEMETLTTVVAETIARDVKQPVKKTFSAADLWNIQKQRRSFVQRRFSL